MASVSDPGSNFERPSNEQSTITRLPTEVLIHIISFLPTVALPRFAASCLAFHRVVHTDAHWKRRFLSERIPQELAEPSPFETWENMYLGHYPFWFLPKHKVWFADNNDADGGLAGKMIITQYDQSTGCIMGYTLVGEVRPQESRRWAEHPGVWINDFRPRLRLHLEKPDIRLRPRPGSLPSNWDKRTEREPKGLASARPAQNDSDGHLRIGSEVMLARPIPEELQHHSMRLWPPPRIPAIDRVRQFTPSVFSHLQLIRSASQAAQRGSSFERPTAHADVCESAFRLRKGAGGRLFDMLAAVADGMTYGTVATFGTLPEEAYRPTKERPYQGIFVGDYGPHGCEFILVRQKITQTEKSASERIWPKHRVGANESVHAQFDIHILADQYASGERQSASDSNLDSVSDSLLEGDELGEVGRLEAIKLTGDPNVPKGEFTFVAEEIGKAGELYVAEGDEFANKRVVESWGHVADPGFTDDIYVSAHLILVSHDCLAQYWKSFEHVSFYRRVDIDQFLDPKKNTDFVQL